MKRAKRYFLLFLVWGSVTVLFCVLLWKQENVSNFRTACILFVYLVANGITLRGAGKAFAELFNRTTYWFGKPIIQNFERRDVLLGKVWRAQPSAIATFPDIEMRERRFVILQDPLERSAIRVVEIHDSDQVNGEMIRFVENRVGNIYAETVEIDDK